MRTAYHEELSRFGARLADLARLAESELGQATQALLDNDILLAGRVTGGAPTIVRLHHMLDDDAVRLLARQQPVATDLRTIVAGLRMSADLERMGTLAAHLADLVEQRHPNPVVPESLRPTVATMGDIARRMAASAREAMANQDRTAVDRLERDDDEMDRLQAMLARQVIDAQPPVGPQTAMDLALVGRYFERFADHTVSLARRVAFLAGELRQATSV